jgi:hypothetical protein
MTNLPTFAPYDRVAVRMPMDRYTVRAGDMLYVIRQDWLDTLVEECRTGFRFIVQTLDLEPWNHETRS